MTLVLKYTTLLENWEVKVKDIPIWFPVSSQAIIATA
jgi:hypothetical protein